MMDTTEGAEAALFPFFPNLSWDLYVCGYKNNFIRRVLETVGAVSTRLVMTLMGLIES